MILRELLLGLTAVRALVAERREDGSPFRERESSGQRTLTGLPALVAFALPFGVGRAVLTLKVVVGRAPLTVAFALLFEVGRAPLTGVFTHPFGVGRAPLTLMARDAQSLPMVGPFIAALGAGDDSWCSGHRKADLPDAMLSHMTPVRVGLFSIAQAV